MEQAWTPQRAANRLVKVTELYALAHGLGRFPVDVPALALETAKIFGWSDPITQIQAASIKGFEGALLPGEEKKEWLLLYSDTVASPGRIRFTQAHELGHYILHRQRRESFECSADDMLNWSDEDKDIEGEADLFASYLLMPLNDFRNQVNTTCDLDVLGACSTRYGVSLQAAILKWLSYTDEKAIVLMSRDGYLCWAWSSKSARASGAFFKTKGVPVPVPAMSLAANQLIPVERIGKEVSAGIWFPHADPRLSLVEMKIYSKHYDSTLTLLRLPRYAEVWKARDLSDE